MPTKKRKYNARFPAGRIKKIMQTDEEVGKVAQAVPIIISITYNNHLKKWELQYRILDGPRTRPIIYSLLTLKGNDPTPRTLELFVESLLSKAMQVTMSRNAKTLSPSHVKQCILAESKFDFLRDLVKNIPDVSAAEERELMSAESSPNSSRFSDMAVPPRRIAREDSNSSSSSDVKVVLPQPPPVLREHLKLQLPTETEPPHKTVKTETVTSAPEGVIDLSKKSDQRPVVTANFYQETLLTDEVQHRSVITVNPTYTSPQPSTSYTPEPIKLETVPKPFFVEKPLVSPRTPVTPTPRIPVTPTVVTPTTTIPPRTPLIQTPRTPVTPILNIDFTKNFANPEIKLLDTAAVNIVSVPKNEKNSLRQFPRQNSKPPKPEVKKIIIKPIVNHPVDIDSLNSGNLQIDEDYDT